MTLSDYQKLVSKLAAERGFAEETIAEKFMMLIEETGEMAKAIRKSSGVKVDLSSKTYDPGEEAVDILFLLFDICNSLDINLEKAFEAKEDINKKREWIAGA